MKDYKELIARAKEFILKPQPDEEKRRLIEENKRLKDANEYLKEEYESLKEKYKSLKEKYKHLSEESRLRQKEEDKRLEKENRLRREEELRLEKEKALKTLEPISDRVKTILEIREGIGRDNLGYIGVSSKDHSRRIFMDRSKYIAYDHDSYSGYLLYNGTEVKVQAIGHASRLSPQAADDFIEDFDAFEAKFYEILDKFLKEHEKDN